MVSVHFDPVQVRDRLIQQIRQLSEEQHFQKVVIGISGGKDSTVTAALCARALGKDHVFGVMLPDGTQADLQDSIRICEALGIHKRIVNIGAIHQALKAATDQEGFACNDGEFSVPYSRASDVNVGPRLRMTVLRYIAQALDARLVGTGNLSEATVGYCTKDGDTSCDFAALLNLTSLEVVQVGLTMPEIPSELVQKIPSDGLTGKSDEENLGLLYSDIHAYIRSGSCGKAEIDEKIRLREKSNMHKRRMPIALNPFDPQ